MAPRADLRSAAGGVKSQHGNPRNHLHQLRTRRRLQQLSRAFLGLFHAIARTHAERTIDGNHDTPSRRNHAGAIDKWIREDQRQQKQHRNSERKQQQIAQPSMPD